MIKNFMSLINRQIPIAAAKEIELLLSFNSVTFNYNKIKRLLPSGIHWETFTHCSEVELQGKDSYFNFLARPLRLIKKHFGIKINEGA